MELVYGSQKRKATALYTILLQDISEDFIKHTNAVQDSYNISSPGDEHIFVISYFNLLSAWQLTGKLKQVTDGFQHCRIRISRNQQQSWTLFIYLLLLLRPDYKTWQY